MAWRVTISMLRPFFAEQEKTFLFDSNVEVRKETFLCYSNIEEKEKTFLRDPNVEDENETLLYNSNTEEKEETFLRNTMLQEKDESFLYYPNVSSEDRGEIVPFSGSDSQSCLSTRVLCWS